MRRTTLALSLVMAAVFLPATMAFSTSAVSFSLTYLDRFKLKDYRLTSVGSLT
jgi:hypothetical protein